MNLQHLKDKELEASFHSVVKSERKIIHLVILHVQEVSRRKLYLAKGYGSLYQYLVQEMKYSSSAAQRRIEAARLMTDVPSVSAKLEAGNINLSQIADLQRAVKESEKIHQVKVTADVKASIIEQLLNQSTSHTQQICAEVLDIPLKEVSVVKTQKDHSRRIENTFTAKQFEKYEILRDLFAHKNFQAKRTQDMPDVLETLFDELLGQHFDTSDVATIKEKSKLKVSQKEGVAFIAETATGCGIEASATSTSSSRNTCSPEVNSKVELKKPWKALTPKRKKIILREDQCCQYTDYETGRICGSTFNLHIDHIQPKWAGGGNEPGNLRVLCREHNLFRQKFTRDVPVTLHS